MLRDISSCEGQSESLFLTKVGVRFVYILLSLVSTCEITRGMLLLRYLVTVSVMRYLFSSIFTCTGHYTVLFVNY